MTVRSLVLVAHRWLGLASGAVLSIVGGTGALMVWPGRYRLRGFVGRLHEELAMGRVGHWIVVASTAVAVVVVLGGLFLWWKRMIVAVRKGGGTHRMMLDLHHSAGVLGFVFLLLLAVTGVGMALTTPADGELRRVIVTLHTARGYPFPIKLLYTLGTTAFVIQAVTGAVMWWKPKKER